MSHGQSQEFQVTVLHWVKQGFTPLVVLDHHAVLIKRKSLSEAAQVLFMAGVIAGAIFNIRAALCIAAVWAFVAAAPGTAKKVSITNVDGQIEVTGPVTSTT